MFKWSRYDYEDQLVVEIINRKRLKKRFSLDDVRTGPVVPRRTSTGDVAQTALLPSVGQQVSHFELP